MQKSYLEVPEEGCLDEVVEVCIEFFIDTLDGLVVAQRSLYGACCLMKWVRR